MNVPTSPEPFPDPASRGGPPPFPEPDTKSQTGTESITPKDELVPPPANSARLVQRRMLKITAVVILVLVISGTVAGFLFRVDYVALVPGSSRDTEPFIAVTGTEDYPSEGEIHLTTIKQRDRVSLWAYFYYQIDDDAELIERSLIFGDRTAEENKEIDLERMASSKDLAIAVALEELGYSTIVSDGIFVLETIEGTPARELLNRGDVIVAVGSVRVASPTQLVDAIAALSPGDQVTFDVERFETGVRETIPVTLTSKADDPTAAFLGVATSERVDIDLDVGFEITLGSANIAGPSAGLAFTLAVLDQLTPGELTGGQRVAVTGTIQVDGSVGPVGGVEQKAGAVRDEGIKAFIVPTALGEETIAKVRERAGDDVTVYPVDDLAGALEVLEGLGGDVDAVAEYAAAVHPS